MSNTRHGLSIGIEGEVRYVDTYDQALAWLKD